MPPLQNIASLGLGIAVVFSCYSPKTTDLNIYTVQPLYFLRDFVANSSYATENIPNLNYTTVLNYTAPSPNTPFLNYPELQYNSSVNFSSLGLPELYYFGISGNIFHLSLSEHLFVLSVCFPFTL
jgi:hypothetical protein